MIFPKIGYVSFKFHTVWSIGFLSVGYNAEWVNEYRKTLSAKEKIKHRLICFCLATYLPLVENHAEKIHKKFYLFILMTIFALVMS